MSRRRQGRPSVGDQTKATTPAQLRLGVVGKGLSNRRDIGDHTKYGFDARDGSRRLCAAVLRGSGQRERLLRV
jgi:hypothetical protein